MGKIVEAVTGMFKAPEIPKIKPISMPDPGAPAAKIAAKRKIESRRKEGRAGTIYTQGGGGAYAGSNLGGTN